MHTGKELGQCVDIDECTVNFLDQLRITVRGTFQALSMDHQSSIIHGLNRLDQQDAARLWIMELSCALWRALFTLLNWQRYALGEDGQ